MLSQTASPDPGTLFSAVRLSGSGPVVAAVSGGGDSLALLLLLNDHLQSLPGAPPLLAVTVDHGLRPESADEARAVGDLAAAHGIAHRIVVWQGPKPETGIAAAAREARLSLLAQAAAEAGTDLVLTGHTADDQAETLAMRLARAAGRGAAGIAPATLHDGRIWFVRPLLKTRREALRAYLSARGVSWIEDPTNRDRRFERARVRQDLDEAAIRRLLARANAAAETREEAGRQVAALIEGSAAKVAPGLLGLPLDALKAAEAEVAVYALRILLAVAGGAAQLPDAARAAGLLARAAEGSRATLARAVTACRRGRLFLHRERRNLPRVPLSHGLVWDGRYRIIPAGKHEDVAVAPFGAGHAQEADIAGFDAPAGLVRAALAAEPALWRGGACLGRAAGSREAALLPLAAPWARLLPSFDLAPARAVLALLGCESPPPSPWRGHKGAVR